MLKINTIVQSARIEAIESAEGKTLKQTPAYRAPRVVEVGKASELLQGWVYRTYRDGTPGYTDFN
jgi:hypothetical protein